MSPMQMMTEGIVIKETPVGENDKYVTVLSRDLGFIEAYAKGARRKGSSLSTSTSIFCYSSFVLFKNKSKYYVDQADINQLFYDIRLDLESLSLASYFCQIIYELKPDCDTSEEILRLVLNALHLLTKGKKNKKIIKSAFELRVMALSGLCPDLVACKKCAEYNGNMRFYISDGNILCEKCAEKDETDQNETGFARITSGVVAAMRHIVYSKPEKVFSFTLDDSNLKLLSEVCESYVICHTERNYNSLDFLKS